MRATPLSSFVSYLKTSKKDEQWSLPLYPLRTDEIEEVSGLDDDGSVGRAPKGIALGVVENV